jgi:hypothetical protein
MSSPDELNKGKFRIFLERFVLPWPVLAVCSLCLLMVFLSTIKHHLTNQQGSYIKDDKPFMFNSALTDSLTKDYFPLLKYLGVTNITDYTDSLKYTHFFDFYQGTVKLCSVNIGIDQAIGYKDDFQLTLDKDQLKVATYTDEQKSSRSIMPREIIQQNILNKMMNEVADKCTDKFIAHVKDIGSLDINELFNLRFSTEFNQQHIDQFLTAGEVFKYFQVVSDDPNRIFNPASLIPVNAEGQPVSSVFFDKNAFPIRGNDGTWNLAFKDVNQVKDLNRIYQAFNDVEGYLEVMDKPPVPSLFPDGTFLIQNSNPDILKNDK